MGKKKAPEPTAEEKALQAAQTNLLKQQTAILQESFELQQILTPVLLEGSGFDPIFDDQGNIIGIEQDPAVEALREDQLTIEQLLADRSLAALRGELPISPTLERELAETEQTLRNTLQQQLGTGFETSSPGIEALAKFDALATELREGARRDELTLSEQLGISRGFASEQFQSSDIGQTTQTTVSNPLAFAQGFGANAAGFNAPLSRLLEDRLRSFQLEISQGGIGGALGSIAGIGLGAFTGGVGTSLGEKVFSS